MQYITINSNFHHVFQSTCIYSSCPFSITTYVFKVFLFNYQKNYRAPGDCVEEASISIVT